VNTLTKLALGLMGHVKPRPASGESTPRWALPAPAHKGGTPRMEALPGRLSQREFATDA
jgi:hypothetical protein